MRIGLTLGLLIAVFISCDEKPNLSLEERFDQSIHNFIPIDGSSTPNYWSTWDVQNYAGDEMVAQKAIIGENSINAAANQLTEENLFGKADWASYFPKVTKDLYILFDLGWNIPQKTKIEKDRWMLGSLELAENKFPSCTGTTVEKLSKLNGLCKKAGWKGAGIRLAAHPANAAYSIQSQMEEIRRIYYDKLRLCEESGIEYLQIDDGYYTESLEFRKMITSVAREAAPGLIIEHTNTLAPVNDYYSPKDTFIYHETGTFSEWGNGSVLNKAENSLNFSDVFYTHDVTKQLSTATTLERVSQIMVQFTEPTITKGIINCGDEIYLAAALGCSMGINRHARFIQLPGLDYDPFSTYNRIDEIFRAVRWQRVAQAFGVGTTPTYVDAKRLTDSWVFKEGDSQARWYIGDTIYQKAPAIVSRGMALPEVESEGEPCYVACSKYPNGAIALATLPRVSADSGLYYPLVDIEINAGDWEKPIAVFGKMKSLTINFSRLPHKFVVWGQDLSASRAIQITDLIEIHENRLKLSGKLMEEVGLLAATPGDVSYPGMMLLIKR